MKVKVDLGFRAPLPYTIAFFADSYVPQPRMSAQQTITSLVQVYEGKLLSSQKPASILADSGATHSFCSEYFAHKNNLHIHPSCSHQVKLADNISTLNVIGYTNIHLQLADVQVECKTLVLSGHTAGFDIIFGDTFFRKYKASLQYSNKALEINSKGLKYIVPNASFSRLSQLAEEEGNIFEDATHSIIGAEEANASIKQGARTTLLWVHPEFVTNFSHKKGEPSKNPCTPITFACCPKSLF